MPPSLSSIAPEYVVDSFLVATRNPSFHGRWMTAETWCNLIKKIYINNTNLEFNGSTLIKALGLKRYQNLKMQMEADQVTADHIGVFSRKYRPKNKPICYCFYATIKGQVPEAKGGKWIDYISDANDVLEKKVTRSEAHYLPSSIIDKLPETSPQRKKRKLGLMASDVSVQQPTSAVPPDTCSSSANHCQSLPPCSSSANILGFN